MFSAYRQIFLWLLILLTTTCWSRSAVENSNQNIIAPPVIKSAIPFSSEEPETFQTEIVISSSAANAKSESRYFLARNGAKRLLIFNRGAKNETAILQTGEQNYLLDYAAKTARQTTGATSGTDDLTAFLTTEYLNQKTAATFEKIKSENNLTEYRVQIEKSNTTEILITVDENINLPIKQEFYLVENEQKTLLYAVELENFKTTADENLFVVPKDFRVIE